MQACIYTSTPPQGVGFTRAAPAVAPAAAHPSGLTRTLQLDLHTGLAPRPRPHPSPTPPSPPHPHL